MNTIPDEVALNYMNNDLYTGEDGIDKIMRYLCTYMIRIKHQVYTHSTIHTTITSLLYYSI